MAAKNVKGITIEIGGNTTGLENAIKGTETSISRLSAEIKDIDKGLKFDPSNIELLGQKSEVLGKEITAVTQKLDTLRDAQKQVDAQFKAGTITDEQYRAFNREVTNTQGVLNGLNGKLSDTNKQLANGGEPLKNLEKEFKAAGGEASTFGDVLKANLAGDLIKAGVNAIGDAIGRVAGAMKGFIADSMNAATGLAESQSKLQQVMRNTMGATDDQVKSFFALADANERVGVVSAAAQTSGAQELATYLTKTDTLKQLIPVMNDMVAQQYGVNASQESATGIATMLGKVMDGQVGALSRYGYKFDDAQAQILKFGTEAERAAVLTDVVSQSVGGMNEALGQTDAGKMARFNATLDQTKISIGNAANAFKAQILGEMLPSVTRLADAMSAGGFAGLADQLGKEVAGWLSMIAGKLPDIIDAGVSMLKSFISGIQANSQEISKAGIDIVSALIGGIASAAPDLAAALFGFIGDGSGQIIDAVTNMGGGLGVLADIVIVLTAAWAGYNTVLFVSTGLTKLETALKIALTGATEAQAAGMTLATAAQIGLNTAMEANPIGLVVAALAALVAIVALVSKALNKVSDDQKAFNKSIEEQNSKVKDLIKTNQDAGKSFEDKTGTIKTEAEANRILAREIENLAAKENKSAADKELLKSKVEQLNQLIPGLTLAWSDESDALNLTTEDIYKQIEARQNMLEFKAREDRQVDLIKQRIELTDQQTAAEQRLADAQKNAAALRDAGANKATMDAAIQSVIDSRRAVDDLRVSLQNTNAAIDENSQKMNGLAGTYTESNDKIIESNNGAAESWKSNFDVIKDAQDKAASKLNEMGSAYDNYAKQVNDAFSPLPDKLKTTADQMIKNLEDRGKAMGDMTYNLGILARAGLDAGVIQMFQDKGIEAAGVVAQMVKDMEKSGTGQIDHMNEAFRSNVEAGEKMVQTQFDSPGWSKAPETALGNIANAIQNNDRIANAAKQSIIDAHKAVDAQVNNSDFEKIGAAIQLGIAAGIKNNQGKVDAAGANIGQQILLHAKASLGISSPSKVFEEEIGKQIALGMAAGIDKNGRAVDDAVTKVAEAGFNNAKNWIDKRVAYDELSAEDQLAAWQYIAKQYPKYSDQQIEADTNAARISKEISDQKAKDADDAFKADTKRIQDLTDANNLSAADTIALWQGVADKYAEGSDQRIAAEQKVLDARKTVQDQIMKLEDDYNTALDAREKKIEGFAGIFDAVADPSKTEITGQNLLDNLKGQVDALQQWSNDLDTLAQRGIGTDLLSVLSEMGPQAAGQIQALTTLTDTQLKEFESMFLKKKDISQSQAETDLTTAKTEMEGKKTELEKTLKDSGGISLDVNINKDSVTATTADALKATKETEPDWTAQGENIVKAVKKGVDNQKDGLKNNVITLGESLMQGLADGIANKQNLPIDAATAVAKAVSAAMASVLEINSPSKVTERIGRFAGQGLTLGLTGSLGLVSRAAAKLGLAATPSPPRPGTQITSGGDNGGGDTYNIDTLSVSMPTESIKQLNGMYDFLGKIMQTMRAQVG